MLAETKLAKRAEAAVEYWTDWLRVQLQRFGEPASYTDRFNALPMETEKPHSHAATERQVPYVYIIPAGMRSRILDPTCDLPEPNLDVVSWPASNVIGVISLISSFIPFAHNAGPQLNIHCSCVFDLTSVCGEHV